MKYSVSNEHICRRESFFGAAINFVVRYGSEGPAHDPYAYEDILVVRKGGGAVRLHLGLGTYCMKHDLRVDGDAEAIAAFEDFVGVSLKTLDRTFARLRRARWKEDPDYDCCL